MTDPDPIGPKTYESYGSGSTTLMTAKYIPYCNFIIRTNIHTIKTLIMS
jgi:hypothetical protein